MGRDAGQGAHMNIRGSVSINDIVTATGLSRATVDRVLNKRAGAHPRTQAHVLRILAHLQSGPREPLALEKRKAHHFAANALSDFGDINTSPERWL